MKTKICMASALQDIQESMQVTDYAHNHVLSVVNRTLKKFICSMMFVSLLLWLTILHQYFYNVFKVE